jgi:hypothetical protein
VTTGSRGTRSKVERKYHPGSRGELGEGKGRSRKRGGVGNVEWS